MGPISAKTKCTATCKRLATFYRKSFIGLEKARHLQWQTNRSPSCQPPASRWTRQVDGCHGTAATISASQPLDSFNWLALTRSRNRRFDYTNVGTCTAVFPSPSRSEVRAAVPRTTGMAITVQWLPKFSFHHLPGLLISLLHNLRPPCYMSFPTRLRLALCNKPRAIAPFVRLWPPPPNLTAGSIRILCPIHRTLNASVV
jgi:hypothetical protein